MTVGDTLAKMKVFFSSFHTGSELFHAHVCYVRSRRAAGAVSELQRGRYELSKIAPPQQTNPISCFCMSSIAETVSQIEIQLNSVPCGARS